MSCLDVGGMREMLSEQVADSETAITKTPTNTKHNTVTINTTNNQWQHFGAAEILIGTMPKRLAVLTPQHRGIVRSARLAVRLCVVRRSSPQEDYT